MDMFAALVALVGAAGAFLGCELVEVRSHEDLLIGYGFFNPASHYRVRMVWPAKDGPLPSGIAEIIEARLEQAKRRRAALGLPNGSTNAYRLLNSEGDTMSGLVVDVFGEVAVAQCSALWVDRHRKEIVSAIERALGVEVVYRVSTQVHEREGLDPDSATGVPRVCEILENGVRFLVDVGKGQKTGFYLDQRNTRAFVRERAAGKRVLDLFCFSGGFSINAALGGAREVVGVDTSGAAVELARHNAELNGVARVSFVQDDAFRYVVDHSRAWDLVICDPPKFCKKASDLDNAVRKYLALNELAIRAVVEGGMLVTCSCSHHVSREVLTQVVREAAAMVKRRVLITGVLGAAEDHVLNPAYPTGEYLKCIVAIVE